MQAPKHEKPEFDAFASQYREIHRANIAITGEEPEFFAEYKILDLSKYLGRRASAPLRILDFGAGVGQSIKHFRKYLPSCELVCADVSDQSLSLASERYPNQAKFVTLGANLPFENDYFDVVFSACVFHHIPAAEQNHWFKELKRVTIPNGQFVSFEHNPWNPLTVRAVNTCPLDAIAVLISSLGFKGLLSESGWSSPKVAYKLFFPRALSMLRSAEKTLTWCPLGAQYRIIATKIS